MKKFIQIHFLTAYPGALLNRDDAGFAKRLPFGNAVRTRISSQCLKRHWRTYDGEGSLSELDLGDTIRSRVTLQKEIVDVLVDEKLDRAKVEEVVGMLNTLLFSNEEKAKKKAEAAEKKKKNAAKGEEVEDLEVGKTDQVTVLGRPEINYLLSLVREVVLSGDKTKINSKTVKDTLKALPFGGGLSSAMFGRMVTSDILTRSDAAVHVAHAFTVHPEQSETDYFSAIDDLIANDGELGSGHIGNVELTSGLYYGYVVIDVPLLVSNITGCGRKDWMKADKTAAVAVIERLIKIICKVSPGAKLGSTAPYSYARFIMVEGTNQQPSTLANAFENSVRDDGDIFMDAVGRVVDYLNQFDQVYGFNGERTYTGIGLGDTTIPNATTSSSLDELTTKVVGWVA